jgi:hypothetical protein
MLVSTTRPPGAELEDCSVLEVPRRHAEATPELGLRAVVDNVLDHVQTGGVPILG